MSKYLPEIAQYLVDDNYQAIVEYYEQAVEDNPEILSNYWYLGLAYLLQQQESAAQTTWLYVLSSLPEGEVKDKIVELEEIIISEANRQELRENYQLAWLLRANLREIVPENINNILQLIDLELTLQQFSCQKLYDWGCIELIAITPVGEIDSNLLWKVLYKTLVFAHEKVVELVAVSLPHFPHELERFIYLINNRANYMAYDCHQPIYAADLMEECIKYFPHDLSLLHNLFWLYIRGFDSEKAIKTAQQIYDLSNSLPRKVLGNCLKVYAMLMQGNWLEAQANIQQHLDLLLAMVEANEGAIEREFQSSFIIAVQMLLYIRDEPRQNKRIQNFITKSLQDNCNSNYVANSSLTSRRQQKVLKIGYIGHTLRGHSVGWLSRWLLHYHDHENFTIAVYLVNQVEDVITDSFFRQKADIFHNLERNSRVISEQIKNDKIDILVDLDSLTLGLTCEVMALKPVPIQVTWLGMDASGIPAIDYFMADPYVLPDNAQEYYNEKIWRLPQCYVAVDGFEVGIPTLRREHLNIPEDSIVYLTVQSSFKRHPDCVRSQMHILKQVNNSYLLVKDTLIKTPEDRQKMMDFFSVIAAEEEISMERIVFLSRDVNEMTHRANLAIADVILDTYPYNGATTTLEALWMGIPMVTRVGEQFAARNSYTFMINAGVSEGISFSQEEYIQWGVRLANDKDLREAIAWKLQSSRQTSPLWNAKQFTREMEKAYRQMSAQ